MSGVSEDDRNASELAPDRNTRPAQTPSKWQVRRPIAAADPAAWRRFDGRLGPLAVLAPS